MGAGSGGGGGGGAGVQGTWLPGARAHRAGRKQRHGWGALPPPKEWFLTSSCHRPLCRSPIAGCEPSPGGGVSTPYTEPGTRLGG